MPPSDRSPGARIPDLPEGARHVCTFVFHFGIDSTDMVAYLQRGSGVDALWTRLGRLRAPEVLAAAPIAGTEPEAARRLFPDALRATLGLGGGPTRFVAAGLVDERAYDEAVATLLSEVEQRQAQAQEEREQARAEPTPIVDLAEELALDPEPSVRHAGRWEARCPGTGHRLQLDARKGLFYCGYCRRGGGPEDLRAFVRERSA